MRPAAEELGQRAAIPQGQQKGGLSDSAVRVLMGYAFSVIPEQQAGPDGTQVKLDKSDPNKFLIPSEDARRIIRAATRSAYAEACELPDLAQANYQALMRSEGAKKTWTEPQLLMVNALYLFSASYFAGNVKITDDGQAPAGAAGRGEPAQGGRAGPGDEPCYAKAAAMPARAKAEGRGRHQRLCSVRAGGTGAKGRGARPGPGARSTGVIQRQLTLSAINV